MSNDRVTWEDYARAERFLPGDAKQLIFNAKVEPHWLDGERFWYCSSSRRGSEFVLVDAASGSRAPAFDHARLAASLSAATGTAFEHNRLPFDSFSFTDHEEAVQFDLGEARWSCDLASYACHRSEKQEPPPKTELRSPDGRWAAFTRDHNLVLREIESGAERQVTHDGAPYNDYAARPEGRLTGVTDRLLGRPLAPAALWSPDSKRLLSYRLDQQQVRDMHLLQSVPASGESRPVLHSYRYPLPGDPQIPAAALLIVDVEQGTMRWVQRPPLPVTVRTPFEQRLAWWSGDGERAYVIHAERGCTEVSLAVVAAADGAARTIVEERGATQVFPHHVPFESTNVHEADGGSEIIWFSQRDGWGHCYLYDAATGLPKRQLTAGAWTVRDVVRVDDPGRWLYFFAGGRKQGRDPYYKHLCRVSLDGGEPELLTPEDAEHAVSFSPSGAYFVDSFSRVDLPPVSVLRAANGAQVCRLEEADVSALLETGWRFPERFSVKARDGVTDLYGMLIRPSTYDPARQYPVIDAIYPGPQTIRTPKAFPAEGGFWQDQAIAELGFLVVTIDGMGTPYRSKAFINVSYGVGFGEAGGLVDHVGGLRQLAARDRSMDLGRVGIYGHSGGGYASTRALLLFPDFYKVAVSSSGNHDQRGYSANWGERYIGLLDGPNYEDQANARLAANLKGKLLLVHGELDDNVHPSLTLQLVDALIAANKDFDFLILPFCNHALFDLRRPLSEANEGGPSPLDNPYFIRRRWDYFVRHLLSAKPPHGYAVRTAAR